MINETSPSDTQLMFPPLFKLPNVEYQVLAEDLGLLSFTPEIKRIVGTNCYKLHARKQSSSYESMIKIFISNVRNASISRFRGFPLTLRDINNVSSQKQMIDTIIDIISKWIELVKPTKNIYTIIIPTSSILLCKLTFQAYKNLTPTKQQLMKDKNLGLLEKFFKCNDKYWYSKHAIFFPNNANSNHWNLFILCNLRQIEKEDGDPFDKLTSEYEIPCILLLDSLSDTDISDETNLFCEMLRFNISNNKTNNPANIQFNNKNLPLFRIKVPQQTDNISYFQCSLRVARTIKINHTLQ